MRKKIILTSLVISAITLVAQTNLAVYQDCSKNGIKLDSTTIGVEAGYEWVDLGLPSGTKWATRNLGAAKKDDIGNYFAWGETASKSSFNLYGSMVADYNYKYYDHNYGNPIYTKYNDNDKKTVLDVTDDAAVATLGNNWVIPTPDDWLELFDNCTSSLVNGCTLTSKINGKSIKLPTTGLMSSNYLMSIGGYCYWTNSLSGNRTDEAKGITFNDYGSGRIYEYSRHYGLVIRPVCKTKTKNVLLKLYSKGCSVPNQYSFNGSKTLILSAIPNSCQRFIRWSDGNTDNPRTITISSDTIFTVEFATNCFTIATAGEHGTVTGSGIYNYGDTIILTATPNEGYHFEQWSDGNTDNPRSVVVTQDSTFTAEFAKQIDSTQIKDVSVFGDCSKNGYKKDFSHIATVNSSSGRTSCEWVQLWENGPKWATFNVGATITNYANLTIGEDPISFSNYTKQAPYYNTANTGGLYPWNNPNVNGRKTTWKSTTGISDVATAIWGSNWKTPTSKQLDTLLLESYGKTTWTWCDGNATQYVAGCTLKGYKVSGVGDYAQFSIFFPAAGYYNKSSGKIADASSYGKYWSGSVSYSGSAYDFLYFYAGYRVNASIRENGNSVRAVLANNVEDDIVILTLKASDCEASNVITCIKDQPLRITATDSECSKFVCWSDGKTENPRLVSINSNSTLIAIFEKIQFNVSINTSDSIKGKVKMEESLP